VTPDDPTIPPLDAGSLSPDGRLAVDEFERAQEGTYLNHAASSPLPRRSSEALRNYAGDRERVFHLYQAGTPDYPLPVLQAKVGRLLSAPPELIAFVPSTAEGLAGAINSIDWRPGDNIVVPANDFPGVLYPCLHLERRGVAVRLVSVERHADLDRVLEAIDGRTRAVAISWVHWLTGHRLDIARLGAVCRATNALSIVDAMQGVGAVPLDVTAAQVDCCIAGSYKWLMGIPGTAAMYTSPRFLAETLPDRAGYAGMRTSVFATPAMDWLPGADRFQVGGPINPALVALERSVDLLLEVGVARVQAHLDRLLDGLETMASAAGFQLNSDRSAAHRSGFLNLTTGDPTRDDRVVKALLAQRIVVGRRGPGIRIAPHLHNAMSDIDTAVNAIARVS